MCLLSDVADSFFLLQQRITVEFLSLLRGILAVLTHFPPPARITYFAQLQAISDVVRDPDFFDQNWSGFPIEMGKLADQEGGPLICFHCVLSQRWLTTFPTPCRETPRFDSEEEQPAAVSRKSRHGWNWRGREHLRHLLVRGTSPSSSLRSRRGKLTLSSLIVHSRCAAFIPSNGDGG